MPGRTTAAGTTFHGCLDVGDGPRVDGLVSDFPPSTVDRRPVRYYIRPMRLWLRLVSLCLSLALLGGVMMHDAAGARMSFDMATSAVADA